jgi:hypothetical protein
MSPYRVAATPFDRRMWEHHGKPIFAKQNGHNFLPVKSEAPAKPMASIQTSTPLFLCNVVSKEWIVFISCLETAFATNTKADITDAEKYFVNT